MHKGFLKFLFPNGLTQRREGAKFICTPRRFSALLALLLSGCASSDKVVWRSQVENLPIRRDSAAFSESVGTVRYKEPVEIIEREGAWAKVRIEGWVHESSLTTHSLTNRQMTSAALEAMVLGTMNRLTNGVYVPERTNRPSEAAKP